MRILAVDFSAIFRRHVAASSDQVFSAAYEHTLRDIWEHSASYDRVVICCDGPRSKSFRRAMFPDYKANREATPREVIKQGARAIEALRAKGHVVFRREEHEADDIIASLCRWAGEAGHRVAILGVDKDLRQCLAPHVMMVNPSTGEVTVADDLVVRNGKGDEYPLAPYQVPEWLAIMGDVADNIPGVPKVGKLTAAKHLATFGSIKGIYENLEALTEKQQEAYRSVEGTIRQSVALATLVADVALNFEAIEAEPVPTVAQSVTETNDVETDDTVPPPADSYEGVRDYPAPDMQWSPQVGELAGALAAAQLEIGAVAKDKRAMAGKYSYSYAGLGDIIMATRPLAKHGVAVVQMPHQKELVTLLTHKSGQWLRCVTPIEYKGGGPQAYGSAVTYARRYALAAIVGVPLDDDDDGAQAQAGYPNRRRAG